MRPPLIVKSMLTATYTVTDSFANVPGLIVTVPKNGWYRAKAFANVMVTDDDGLEAACYPRLAIDGEPINGTVQRFRVNDNASGGIMASNYYCEVVMYLKKDVVFSMQASMNTGDNSLIYYSATSEPSHGFVSLERI